MLETSPSLPATALGEPLDADPDEIWGGLWSDVDPVDIGLALDAGDPPANAPGRPAESLLQIGELLDADNPPAHAPATQSELPLHIGELLDAGAPTGGQQATNR